MDRENGRTPVLTTKSIRLTEDEVADLHEYLELSDEVEAVALRRAAVRGIRELRMTEAIARISTSTILSMPRV